MKKINSILRLLVVLISSTLFQSCLKDDSLTVADNTNRVITEFTKGDSANISTLGVPLIPGLNTYDAAEIRVLPRSLLTGNVSVTVALNPGLIDAYNLENGTTYQAPPPSVFSFTSTMYTLTPESRTAQLKVMVDPEALVGEEYAVGFTITSVSAGEISVIKKDILLELVAKNQYDGEYTSNGYFYHPSSPRAISNRPKFLQTVSPTAVVCELGDLGAAGYFALLDVDASNRVTITAYPGASGAPYTMFTTGLPASNPGYTPQWPGAAACNNTYDPSTKQFRLRYGYMGPTGWRVTEEFITMD